MPFEILNQANKGRVEITGEIGWWRTSGDYFTQLVNDLLMAGIIDIDVYINTIGGSKWDADEIGNQLKRFPGYKKAILGALCCSAGTTLACEMDYVEAAPNLHYMIHDVSMQPLILHEEDFDSNKQMYQICTNNAIATYHKKTKIEPETLRAMMRATTWMDAPTAKKKGFIDAITGEDAELPEDTAEVLAKMKYKGVPEVLNKTIIKPEDRSMEKIALKLGLPANATQDQILAKLAANEDAASLTNTEAGIKALVALAENRGLKKESIEKLAKADFDTTLEMVLSTPEKPANTNSDGKGEQPDNVRMSDVLAAVNNQLGAGSSTAQNGTKDWTLEDWEKKDPEGLKTMMRTTPAQYQVLFKNENGIEVSLSDIQACLK